MAIRRPFDIVFPPIAEDQRYPYWRLVLRGCSQLCFQSNELTGALILLAVLVHSPISAAYLLAAGLLAPAGRMLLGAKRPVLVTGLPGLNPSLIALALPAYFATGWTDVGMWIVLVVCVGATVVLTHFSVRYLPLPTLTVPFLLTFWTLDAFADHLSVVQPLDVATAAESTFRPLTALFDSLGGALFAPIAASGVLFAIAVLVSNWRYGVVAICGAGVGTFVSYYYRGVDASGDLVLYGFNGVLAALAVYAVCGEKLRLAILGALLATIMVPAFGNLPVETLSAPFVVTTWLVLGLGWLEKHWFTTPREPSHDDS